MVASTAETAKWFSEGEIAHNVEGSKVEQTLNFHRLGFHAQFPKSLQQQVDILFDDGFLFSDSLCCESRGKQATLSTVTVSRGCYNA